MKVYKPSIVCLFLLMALLQLYAQKPSQIFKNDSITLAEAYINLSLAKDYFDQLNDERLSKILPFETNELESIQDSIFIIQNSTLYNVTYSLLYFNDAKLLFRNKPKTIERNTLIKWHDTLKKAIIHFNLSEVITKQDNVFYELINFDEKSFKELQWNINALKSTFTPYINNAVYQNFKEIFYEAKQSKTYDFDRLLYDASVYDLDLNLSIIQNRPNYVIYNDRSINPIYPMDLKLDLIARYLQMKYMVSDQYTEDLSPLDITRLYDAYDSFYNDIVTGNIEYEDDDFIQEELNPTVCHALYKELQKKYALDKILDSDGDGVIDFVEAPSNTPKKHYFFPNPAPYPSTSATFYDFRPELATLGNVDAYINNQFIRAGYKNKLHYYYDLDGFAMTTSLEKFNKDGTPVEDKKRWVKNLGGDGKFSYYEIFKSLFFETESEFRMFAIIVASKKVTISNVALTPASAETLIENSHPALPDNLKNKTLDDKILTVLVYHFHQNDIGEVPMLDLSGKTSVEAHLKKAGLSDLIRN